jgi:uncharacterized protein (UPF0264 family)
MANEVSVAVSLRVRNGNADESFSVSGAQFNQSTQGSVGGIVQIGTNVETLSLGDVTTAGYAAFRNLSTATSGTAYIALGAYDGTNLHEFVSMRRGQPALVPLRSNVTVAAKSYGQATQLRYIIFSE